MGPQLTDVVEVYAKTTLYVASNIAQGPPPA